MQRKVLLIYTNVRIRNQKPRPPVGLLYLAAALRPQFEPVLLDMRTNPDSIKLLLETLPDCIFAGISTIIGQQLNFSLETAKLIRRLSPQTPIVFGGTFPSMAPEVVLKESCIDVVSIGDGEDTLVRLASAFVNGTPLSDIPDLAYKEDGKVIIHRSGKLRQLDTPEMPAWDMVNVDDYREVNVLTSKGCPAGCTFCYDRIFNCQQFRTRKIGNVWREITYLHQECGVQHIAFVDDNFFANQQHAKEVMYAFRDSGWGMTWETTCRADDLCQFDEEMLSLIRDSGCKELFVGFESASDQVLQRANKQIKTDQMTECMKRAREYGFRLRALFVIGMVGESRKELLQTLKTVDYLRKKYSDCVKIPVFGIYTPYPQLPPDLSGIKGSYHPPETMQEWAEYHHDQANHQWLTKGERAYLENVIWVYRYFSKRSKFTQNGDIRDKLLYYDACIRWKFRFFSLAPEWGAVRKNERKKYLDTLSEIRKQYQEVSISAGT